MLSMRSNKIKGCLIGGAVGDALGYPVEFMSIEQIRYKYGPSGITGYVGTQISDDTQMTLFTLDGLLYAKTFFPKVWENRVIIRQCVFHAYQDWLLTQTREYPIPDDISTYSQLIHIPEMFSRRAPGTTCINALNNGEMGTINNPLNDSKGCGGLMRVAPVALALYNTRLSTRETALIGADIAAITHGHELGYMPAAALVYILTELLKGQTLSQTLKEISPFLISLFPESENLHKLLNLITQAQLLAEMNIPEDKAFEILGQGWVAEETLAIAIFCALKYHDNFEKGVLAAINHSGDSDSTGSVTGQILGTALGIDAISYKYIDCLELKDIILELAQDLQNSTPLRDLAEKYKLTSLDINYHYQYGNILRKYKEKFPQADTIHFRELMPKRIAVSIMASAIENEKPFLPNLAQEDKKSLKSLIKEWNKEDFSFSHWMYKREKQGIYLLWVQKCREYLRQFPNKTLEELSSEEHKELDKIFKEYFRKSSQELKALKQQHAKDIDELCENLIEYHIKHL